MKKKAKRYEEGGGVREGQNANIDDDTRARAMKWLQQQQESEAEVSKPASKATAKRAAAEEQAPAYRRGASQLEDYRSGDYSANRARNLESGMSRGRPAEEGASPKVNLKGTSYNPPKFDPDSGERVDSTELGRNFSALMNSTGPGRIATGLSLAAREAAAAKAAQKAYNARAATRRAEEGLNATEAAAAKQAIRERKTLNPLSWMSGPKGMDNFKKGGVVKKAAVSSASKRADGIATKGKTKGRFV